jgi:transcriptional regulator of acetoin/glycerol metabolism
MSARQRPAAAPMLTAPGPRPDVASDLQERLARARVAFLADEPVPEGVVPRPVLASWTRSRESAVRPDRLELRRKDVDGDTPLTRAAATVLRQAADQFATEPVSVILCDAEGVVLDRLTGDSALEQQLDAVSLAPGFSYAEQSVGTNGIGTALEARGPAHVFGHEHYAEHLEGLACAGMPVRHPVTGRVLGVLDLTCWQRDAGPLLIATAGTLTHRIEEMLVHHSAARELAVFQDYLTACRRNRGPVIAVGDDLLMMNDRARDLLDPQDQEPLLVEAREALAAGRRHALVLDLPSGRTVRVRCRPTLDGLNVLGGVLDVQLLGGAAVAQPRPAAAGSVVVPSAVGRGPAWVKCIAAANRHLQAGEWLVLEGEPGSGRETVARAAHQAQTPSRRLRVLAAEEIGDRLADDVSEELAAGPGTLVVTGLNQLTDEALADLGAVLEPWREEVGTDRPWVVATVAPADGDPSPALGSVLASFPSTVLVPPLRRHIEDLADLVPHLLTRLTRGGGPSCSPEVMRVLMHNRWPGNVEQLVEVLRRVVGRRRSGIVTLQDLPAECWVTGKRVLTPLESLECDAIVEALLDAGGSKVEAARRLSMSRATIYRKVGDYGIVLPDPAQLTGGR